MFLFLISNFFSFLIFSPDSQHLPLLAVNIINIKSPLPTLGFRTGGCRFAGSGTKRATKCTQKGAEVRTLLHFLMLTTGLTATPKSASRTRLSRRGNSYIWLAGTRIPPYFFGFWPSGGFSWVALHAACLSLPFGALRGFRRCLSAGMPCGISAAAFAWLAAFFFVALTSSPCPGSSDGLRHLAGASEALARLCGGRASTR